MKKCLRCTKQATLHITEIKGGKAVPLHLCESCAQDYLSTVDLGGLTEQAPEPQSAPDEVEATETSTCPHCGITYKQFRSQGRLGCPHDYDVFRDELIPLLESIHGETQHVGKCPPQAPANSKKHYELIRLRSELKSAIDREHYEEAAGLRDKIRELESGSTDEPSQAAD